MCPPNPLQSRQSVERRVLPLRRPSERSPRDTRSWMSPRVERHPYCPQYLYHAHRAGESQVVLGAIGGLPYVVWGFVIRMLVTMHMTW